VTKPTAPLVGSSSSPATVPPPKITASRARRPGSKAIEKRERVSA